MWLRHSLMKSARKKRTGRRRTSDNGRERRGGDKKGGQGDCAFLVGKKARFQQVFEDGLKKKTGKKQVKVKL